MKHARVWKDLLSSCSSLDDVRKEFSCGSYHCGPEGSWSYVHDPNTFTRRKPCALLYDFPTGDWLAMAYASSHNTWGGGTVVTRDNTGTIRIFFGHVCGKPFNDGNSLQEIYDDFNDSRWEEVNLEN